MGLTAIDEFTLQNDKCVHCVLFVCVRLSTEWRKN